MTPRQALVAHLEEWHPRGLRPDQRPPGWYTGADPVPKDTA